MTRAYVAIGLLAIAIALGVGYVLRPKAVAQFVTAPVVRESLAASVTATGIVNPQNTISVGTQVSGTIAAIVADYNDPVRKGQVLARIDPTLLQAALDQTRGNLMQAESAWRSALANARGATSSSVAANANANAVAQNVSVARESRTSADANVLKARAASTLAVRTMTRDRSLLRSGFIAQSQYDADDANRVATGAALSGAVVTASQVRMQLDEAKSQATVGLAQGSAAGWQATGFARTAAADLAAIAAARALVRASTINLRNTVITSPVQGTVIARNVSVGQTVAASFQTPTLYTIAQDLAKMEIDVAVGEPDIGSVRVGQAVAFTVLAFPNSVFHGIVAQVRENPTTIANVVTYDTVVYVNNGDGRLRPGMTASASIRVAHADNALVVPLAALNFRAPASAAAAPARASSTPRPATVLTTWGSTGVGESAPLVAGSRGHIAVVTEGALHAVPVTIVLVSGGQAAIRPIGETLAPGSQVAVSGAARTSTSPR